MRFVSILQEAPGCFATGRATTGSAIASASSFASLSPVAGSAAFRIPSPVDLSLELPRLIVDRIRRDGRARPVHSLCGVSVRCLPRPVAGFQKLLRTARNFWNHSLRFESCRPKKNAPEWEHFFWVDRIRTCGMTAPKAVGLPLADDPKMSSSIYYFSRLGKYLFLHDQRCIRPGSCPVVRYGTLG